MAQRTTLKFDEINRLDYREYFGEMYITPEQMRKRIDLAHGIEDVMLYLFAYWTIAIDAEISKAELKQDVENKLTEVIEKRAKLDPYIKAHITQVVNEVVDATERNEARAKRKKDQDEENFLDEFERLDREAREQSKLEDDEDAEEDEQDYWTSRERAMLISANEANAFENYLDYREAKEQGKTKKRWLTQLDERVRFDHAAAEGQTVDIDGLFLIGGYEMRFPMDAEYGAPANETVRCRCACEYL